MNKTGPTINRSGSKQTYSTPDDFIQTVEGRFGRINFDLAASWENKKSPTTPSREGPCGDFFSEEQNSLVQDWSKLEGNLWLNPPFADIEPWAKKCAETSMIQSPVRRILLLVPASVGSEWYRKYVEPYAYVLAVNPRITFVGCKDPYPKDMILACYGHNLTGFKSWRWK